MGLHFRSMPICVLSPARSNLYRVYNFSQILLASLSMSGFQPVHYVPASRQAQMLAMPVKRILAVPHRKAGGTNHWCLYLSSSSTSSVRIDCQPSHTVPSSVLRGGSKANLIISELPYEISTDAQAQFVLDVAPGLSVGQVWGEITRYGWAS
ncbi:S-adenosyl-L-methionine-dependent methyltransferase [Penicillium digitatum]|uniref:S-adenosyl-L-methionine-dependent methyltransferase n=1 Tax=Penicillium digitatum TaxID=36651 RepID=A0A7T6XP04_PENDI|nr:S-adenosyl-L-methionine-dependent methyltransferase [Penicillium digitatum]